jgi:uncharacterized membrane protein YqjE
MSEDEGRTGGIAGAIRRIADGLMALLQTRLQLFALEVQSEKLRLVELLIKVAIALALGLVGVGLGILTLALYVWQTSRFTGLVAMTGVFLLAAAFLLWRLRSSLRKEPVPFAKTLNELKKDRACLTGKD